MNHTMKLNPIPFGQIAGGEKTIELRLFDEKRQALSVGDTITFTNTETGEEYRGKIVALHRFGDFAALYQALPLTKCGYTEETVRTASYQDMYAYYTPQQEARYGVLGIELGPESPEICREKP